MKKLNIILFVFIVSTNLFALERTPIAKKVQEAKLKANKNLNVIDNILVPDQFATKTDKQLSDNKSNMYFDYNKELAKNLIENTSEFISLKIPFNGESDQNLTLDLIKVSESFNDYALTLSNSLTPIAKTTKGNHYRGVVRDSESKSIVALSIFENQMIGIISMQGTGTFNIGRLDKEGKHFMHNDANFKTSNEDLCYTSSDNQNPILNDLYSDVLTVTSDNSTGCLNMYIEVDHDIYKHFGNSISETENFVAGIFNQVASLYENESVTLEISEIFIWNTQDNYGSNINSGLESFVARRPSFNGDLAHLLTFRNFSGNLVNNAGGRANGIGGLCVQDNNNLSPHAITSIYPDFNTVPNFSRQVKVITHEIGHNLGSRHTHACVWNENNTAIDNCAGRTEGTCSVPSFAPANKGGTIMSYCDRTIGIDFSRGFGAQPGNVIRSYINQASCLKSCDQLLPDLTLENCGFGSISTQEISLLGITVQNKGDQASGATQLSLYLSNDGVLSQDDRLISSYQVGSILPSATVEFIADENISELTPPLPEGTYNILFVVDDENVVTESNETNNTCSTNTFTVTCCSDNNSCTYSNCDACVNDRAALIALYNATNGPNWRNTWDLTKPMANWDGIKLNDNGCVTSINLMGNNLSGSLPSELGDLEELTYMRLNNNSLTGSIPTTIGNLTKLKSLYLSYNQLSGQIPFEMIGMVSLRNLQLNDNKFTGELPETLGGLPLLTELSVKNNQLSAPFSIRLESLCEQLSDFYNSNAQISNGNNFDISWEEFCNPSPPPTEPIITCLNFDGTNDYVQMSNKPANAIATRNFTFEAWIEGLESEQAYHPVVFSNRKTVSTGGFMLFFHGKWGGSQYKMLGVQLNNKNYMIVNNGTFNGSLLDGNCHHIAVTLKGQTLSFYADGELFGTKTVVGNPNISSTVPLWVGADQRNGKGFNGSISQIRMWKAARSANQIKNNMNRSISGTTANLVSYWEVDEYEGQTLIDKTGLANGRLGSTIGDDNKDPQWLRAGQCCFNPDDLRLGDWAIAGAIVQNILVEQNQPNPASDFTSITYSTVNETKAADLKIYNVTGKLMKQFDLDNSEAGSISVDVKNMQPGLYLYTITANDGSSVTKKMMIQQ